MGSAETYRCALCERDVPGGGHPCFVDNGRRDRPEEHLAMCGVCAAFHEPHCIVRAPRPDDPGPVWSVDGDGPNEGPADA